MSRCYRWGLFLLCSAVLAAGGCSDDNGQLFDGSGLDGSPIDGAPLDWGSTDAPKDLKPEDVLPPTPQPLGGPCQVVSTKLDIAVPPLLDEISTQCTSGLCLGTVHLVKINQCTKVCTNNSDCPGPTPECQGGFSCDIIVEPLGSFQYKCCKFCVCGGSPVPPSKQCDGVTPECPK